MNEQNLEEMWDHHCIVCDKTVDAGGGFCHVSIGNEMIALCCPLCIETFNKDPKTYVERRMLQKANAKQKLGS